MNPDAIERARALLGTRFRAQGRKADFGLDCVGLIILAHGLPTRAAPGDYALRGTARALIEQRLRPWFRRVSRPRASGGDVLLLQPTPDVLHLGVWSGDSLIHADARHGVVERPGPAPWPTLAVFRRRKER